VFCSAFFSHFCLCVHKFVCFATSADDLGNILYCTIPRVDIIRSLQCFAKLKMFNEHNVGIAYLPTEHLVNVVFRKAGKLSRDLMLSF